MQRPKRPQQAHQEGQVGQGLEVVAVEGVAESQHAGQQNGGRTPRGIAHQREEDAQAAQGTGGDQQENGPDAFRAVLGRRVALEGCGGDQGQARCHRRPVSRRMFKSVTLSHRSAHRQRFRRIAAAPPLTGEPSGVNDQDQRRDPETAAVEPTGDHKEGIRAGGGWFSVSIGTRRKG